MPDAFLTVAEIAELLKVNPQTVRNWIDRGELPGVRVGRRRVRVRRSDLDEYLAAGTPEPANANQMAATDAIDDPSATLWARLGRAMADSVSATADGDHAALADSLRMVSAAATHLANVLAADSATRDSQA
jgi:excisionase family DNA binding protein